MVFLSTTSRNILFLKLQIFYFPALHRSSFHRHIMRNRNINFIAGMNTISVSRVLPRGGCNLKERKNFPSSPERFVGLNRSDLQDSSLKLWLTFNVFLNGCLGQQFHYVTCYCCWEMNRWLFTNLRYTQSDLHGVRKVWEIGFTKRRNYWWELLWTRRKRSSLL